MGPTGKHHIIEVHPTRRCNLRCLHCYSSSGPEAKQEVSIATLVAAIGDAARLGYTAMAVSGGEPLLYEPLPSLLAAARAQGMMRTVTTNGMLLTERYIDRLVGTVDLLAISLDGTRESHNIMRGSAKAFDAMASRLPALRRSGIPFGFIFTLTFHNLHELDSVAQFAVEQGASLLQVHPLEETGRAAEKLQGERPDATEAAYALLEVLRLQARFGDQLCIQLDFTDRLTMAADPSRVFANDVRADEVAPFANLVAPLIIEADGTAVPLQYGFAREYSLGNINHMPLFTLAVRWRQERYPAFRRLCQTVFRQLTRPRRVALLNWYEQIAMAAIAHTPRRTSVNLAAAGITDTIAHSNERPQHYPEPGETGGGTLCPAAALARRPQGG